MVTSYDSLGESGLRFFGKVSASISHEMKNILAIINENAGLLEDLSFAARRGSPIDPDRLDRTVQNFQKQIRRADDIMKNMSRFAHSVDQQIAAVNLYELTDLVATLAGRFAAMRKITFETIVPTELIALSTNPYLLENLIWLALELAMAATPADHTIQLIPEKNESGARLQLVGLTGLTAEMAAAGATGCREILAALGASLTCEPANHQIILALG